ncbi:MAG: PH domain-containing protein, partial [Promethearchaeota archaeon]
QRNIQYINEIQTTHPTNLMYASEILFHFERERKKVENLAKNEVEPLNSRLVSLEKKVEFMERMQAIFNGYLPKMNIDADERIVFGLKCKLSSGANADKDFSKKNGTILITNRRIYFYYEKGIFKKKTVELFAVKLADLEAAQVKGKLIKKVSLKFLHEMYDFSLSRENRALLVEWIERAQEFDLKNTLNMPEFKKFNKYRLTTKMFNEELENAIYNLVGYRGFHNPISNRGGDPNNNMFDTQIFRASQFGNPQNRNAGRRYNPHGGSMNSQFIPHSRASSGPNPPQPRFDAQTGTPLYQNNQNYQTYHNPRNSSPYQHPSQSHPWGQNTPRSGSFPKGHFGYPHDKSNLGARNPNPYPYSTQYSEPPTSRHYPDPNAQTYFNQNTYQEPFSSNHYGYGSNARSRSPFPPQQNNPFQSGRPDPSYPSNSSYSNYPSGSAGFTRGQQFNSEEMNRRAELEGLRSDQHAFQSTLQNLEQQYNRGVIGDPEFSRSNQELSREYNSISSKIEQLDRYIQEKFGY